MAGRFDGKVALVTGAGSGMGRAIVLRLASEGATVLGVDIDEGRLAETKSAASGTVSVRQADLADPQACADAVDACVAEHGGLDVLGNVAGIWWAKHLGDVTVPDYRRMMAVNLDAYFFLAQAAVPYLLERGGNIVNIASNAGLQGLPYSAVYCASKGGVVQLTKALAIEFVKTLRVNAIAPAGTNTNLFLGGSFPADPDPELMGRLGGHRGMAEPEEVAGLFAFLASDEARSITGAIYTLDNGITSY
jgi:meso-butanediol dehydrogenase/(S,S)-butanediol dehydrogenase/diacetyl reductase